MKSTLDVVLLFLIFSFAGWIWECFYMSITEKRVENRGFLAGPYIPIYGFGGILLQLLLNEYSDGFLTLDTVKLYIIGVLTATILEYMVSLILEKLFNARWWDYSDYKFNLNGRICLIASLFWGLISVLFVQVINPLLITKLNNVNRDFKISIASAILAIMFVDSLNTLLTILDFKSKLNAVYEAENSKFEVAMTKLEEIPKEYKAAIMTKINKSYLLNNLTEVRLIKAFPKLQMTSKAKNITLNKIKSLILKGE